MERVNRILAHPQFRAAVAAIEETERDRVFCRHGMEHLLTTARFMALLALDLGLDFPREEIYAAALLHDIGRAEEYLGGLPHEEASPKLADPILTQCGFAGEEKADILRAIREHRSGYQGERSPLGELLCRGDKESRPCFSCPASGACNWPESKKNHTISR